MITIPIANRLSPAGGAQSDGIIYGEMAHIAPVTALSQVALTGSTRVLRGNSDAAGAITWSDITSAANNDTAGDVSIFDAANPTNDMLCFELAAGDEMSGLALLVSTAGAFTGTPAAEVRYRTASGWTTAAGVVTPSLTGTGLKVVTFTPVNYASVALIDDPLDPFNQPQTKCLFLRFTGITGVTTAPLMARAWKRRATSATTKATNFTTMVNQGAGPDFSAYQNQIIPVTGDITAFGWDEIPARMNVSIYRPSQAGLGARKLVYSKGAGVWGDVPAASVVDASALFSTAPVVTGAPEAYGVSTLAGITEWFRPDALVAGSLASWTDGAGAANNLTAVGSPTVVANVANGLPVVRFNGTTDSFDLATPRSDVRTMFIVFREDAADADNSVFIFGHATTYHYHRGAGKVILGTPFTAATQNGSWRINGATVSPTVAVYPTTLSIMSVEATGNTDVGKLGRDRDITGRFFQGDVAEWLVFNGPVTSDVRQRVEGYLAHKYGLAASLPVDHPYRWAVPGLVPTPVPVVVIPPADWGKLSMTDTGDVAHNRYWLGWQYTADTTAPVLPFNATLRGQLLKAAGNAGIPSPEAATYTVATMVCRDTSPQPASLLIVNSTQGKSASVNIPANAAIASATISLPVVKGDAIIVSNPIGSGAAGIGDGALFLS